MCQESGAAALSMAIENEINKSHLAKLTLNSITNMTSSVFRLVKPFLLTTSKMSANQAWQSVLFQEIQNLTI